jgi:hypothetical protein
MVSIRLQTAKIHSDCYGTGYFGVNTTLIANKKLTTSHSFPEALVFDEQPFCQPNAIFASWRPIAEKLFYSSN